MVGVDADLVGDVGGQLCAIGGVWVNIKHQACERIMDELLYVSLQSLGELIQFTTIFLL